MKFYKSSFLENLGISTIASQASNPHLTQAISDSQNPFGIDLENISKELKAIVLSDSENTGDYYSQNEKRLADSDPMLSFSASDQPVILAQAIPGDAENPVAPPIDNTLVEDEAPMLSSKTIADGIEGGGGLSHLSILNFVGPLSHEALPGKTTASSGESHTGFVKDAESQTIDGLFGIPIEHHSFSLSDAYRTPDVILSSNVFSSVNHAPVAVDDFNQITVILPSITFGGDDGEDILRDISGNVLANDSDPDPGDSISLIAINGHPFNSEVWTLNVNDGAGGDEGFIGGGWSITFGTLNNPAAYTFSNSEYIPIFDNTTIRSEIATSNITEAITSITVTFNDLNHTFFGDLSFSLTTPQGYTADLFQRVQGGVIFDHVTLTLDDNAFINIGDPNDPDDDDLPISGIKTATTESGSALNDLVTHYNNDTIDGRIAVGNYGKFIFDANGDYHYEVDITNPTVITSDGAILHDSASYTIADSAGLTSTATLSIDIQVLYADNNIVPT